MTKWTKTLSDITNLINTPLKSQLLRPGHGNSHCTRQPQASKNTLWQHWPQQRQPLWTRLLATKSAPDWNAGEHKRLQTSSPHQTHILTPSIRNSWPFGVCLLLYLPTTSARHERVIVFWAAGAGWTREFMKTGGWTQARAPSHSHHHYSNTYKAHRLHLYVPPANQCFLHPYKMNTWAGFVASAFQLPWVTFLEMWRPSSQLLTHKWGMEGTAIT